MFIRRKGFTLIELMIVIAIIGILAGMALPRFSKAREQAKMKTCWGNAKNLESAVEMVNMEGTTDVIKEDVDDLAGHESADQIKEYLAGRKFPQCPSGGSYSYNLSEGKGVLCSEHGNAQYPPKDGE